MSSPADHRATFIAALPEPLRDAAHRHPNLGQKLESIHAGAAAAWPGLPLPIATFLPYLAERVSLSVDIDRALGGIQAEDLYVACACVHGVPGAYEAFETAHGSTISAALASMGNVSGIADEVRQRVLERLFVAPEGARPKLCSYSGRGPLRSWLRAVAIRDAISVIRKHRKEVPGQAEALAALPDPADDPELMHLKGVYRTAFKTAFESAFASLSARDRTLLRYRYSDGANIDDIATVYRVHRATAARWIAKIREQLFAETKRAMATELEVVSTEFDSIMRLIQSRLHVSISGHFGASSEVSEDD